MRRRLQAAVLSLVAGLVLAPAAAPFAEPVVAPARVAAVGPLPDCRLDDILTEPRGLDDWEITLVDWILTVGPGYRPDDLVPIGNAGVTGGGSVRRVAIDDLEAMADAARAAGVPLGNVSAFRGFRQQVDLFGRYARGYGFEEAITFSARPGHSEHQLGLVIDFAAAGTTSFVSETSRTGRWLKENGWKYGWLMSYPKGKADVVCYSFEPWHYRYVGREVAAAIHESGLTIREYLWANHTQVDPGCVALPAPTVAPVASPVPSARSCAIPDPTPVPTPTAVATSPPTTDPPPSGAASPPIGPSPAASPSPAPTGSILGIPAAALAIGLLAVLVVVAAVSFSRARTPGRR
jgi:D-alanyl-D-alanine carboxypeptidase